MSTDEWLNRTANSIQAVLGHVYFCDHTDELETALQKLIEPRTGLEALLSRGLVLAALLRILKTTGETVNCSNVVDDLWGLAAAAPFEALRTACERRLVVRDDPNCPVAHRVKAYVDVHYAETISSTDAARALGVTVQSLNQHLKQSTGMTFKKYLIAVRMRTALGLIETGVKVEAAALAVGYHAKGTFYRLCRRYGGASPTSLARSVRIDRIKTLADVGPEARQPKRPRA